MKTASGLITEENNVAVRQVLAIAKQDIAIDSAIKALNELNFINKIQFEDYGTPYGVSPELLAEINQLQDKLKKARYGRF